MQFVLGNLMSERGEIAEIGRLLCFKEIVCCCGAEWGLVVGAVGWRRSAANPVAIYILLYRIYYSSDT